MKKIISIVAIIALVALIFTLAACGDNSGTNNSTTNNTANSTTNSTTSMKDDGSSMMEGMSSALSGIGDDLTQGGNVTDNQSSTGLLEGLTSNNTDSTSAGDATSSTSAPGSTGAAE